jgi:hypothetical protein
VARDRSGPGLPKPLEWALGRVAGLSEISGCWPQGRTAFIISRLSTIRSDDCIEFMRSGSVGTSDRSLFLGSSFIDTEKFWDIFYAINKNATELNWRLAYLIGLDSRPPGNQLFEARILNPLFPQLLSATSRLTHVAPCTL